MSIKLLSIFIITSQSLNDNIESNYELYMKGLCLDKKHYSWSKDRFNQEDNILDCKYTQQKNIDNITIYVLDTGLDINHKYLKNVKWGADCTLSDCSEEEPEIYDVRGHGTKVTGIINSKYFGLTERITTVGVKILGDNGTGTRKSLINGLMWAYYDNVKRGTKGIINLSIVSKYNELYDDDYDIFFQRMKEDDMIIIVSAGNDDEDACNKFPAHSKEVITVGSSSITDSKSSFSNYGSCVDIYAPGQNIITTKPNNKLQVVSGTSFSAPYVVSLVASLWNRNPKFSPDEITELLYSSHTNEKNIAYLLPEDDFNFRFLIVSLILVILVFIPICVFCFIICKCLCRREITEEIVEEREGELSIEVTPEISYCVEGLSLCEQIELSKLDQ